MKHEELMVKSNLRPHANLNTPKGIHRVWTLPDTCLGALWDSIILEDEIKSQLLSQAVLNFTIRGKQIMECCLYME